MGKRARQHREKVIAGMEPPYRQPTTFLMVLKCGKCHNTITEGGVTEHLKQCQPGGAKCGRCGERIKPDIFLEHFKACQGKKKIGASDGQRN